MFRDVMETMAQCLLTVYQAKFTGVVTALKRKCGEERECK